VSGDGTYHTATQGNTPGGFNPNVVGTWQWVAVYTPDGNNNPTSSPCGAEPLAVTPATPGITTQTSPSTETVGTGHLNDSATLAGGFNPTGTITFSLYAPGQACSGTASYTDVVTVTGNGTFSTATQGNNPGGFVPNVFGTWQWQAVYASGNGNNNSVSSGCGSEPVNVTPPPSVGFTMGFWHNQNGHAILDPKNDGFIYFQGVKHTWTIGLASGSDRYANVSTLAQSDKILPSTNACGGTPNSFNLSCNKLPHGLQVGTLNNLAGQTLALTYNQNYVKGFSAQTLGSLGCTVPASLKVAPYSLGPSSTMAQVLAAANLLIGQAIQGGSTSQQTASDMTGLLGDCVNTRGQ
jgi:hypothetical protein